MTTLQKLLDLDPGIKPMLQNKYDQLGFSNFAHCIAAILEADDWATSWELDNLEDQKQVELWRTAALNLWTQIRGARFVLDYLKNPDNLGLIEVN